MDTNKFALDKRNKWNRKNYYFERKQSVQFCMKK